MNKCVVHLILTLNLCLFTVNTYPQTNIPGGEVSGVWKPQSSPYLILGDITIPVDSTLEIKPGVSVEFQGHYGIDVKGSLIAMGTFSDSIHFTVTDTTGFQNSLIPAGGWNGIQFVDTPVDQDSSILMYCRLEYGKAIDSLWYGNSGGAISVINFHKLLLAHNTFIHNKAGGLTNSEGGAIHIFLSDIALHHNLITLNSAEVGGGIRVQMSNPIFQQNTISHNSALEGGGISMYASMPDFTGDLIQNNHAILSGGGIFMIECQEGSSFSRVAFVENNANWGGGLGLGYSAITFDSCAFENNDVSWLGGAFAADYCNLDITSCTFNKDTTSDSGGAVHLDHSDVLISFCQFTENSALNGGAINSVYSEIELFDTHFGENDAQWNGGALHIVHSNLISINAFYIQNIAENSGGAIYYFADSIDFLPPYQVRLQNSLFNANSAGYNAGAIFLQIPEESEGLDIGLLIDHCIFSENYSERNSAIQIMNFDDLVMTNTLVTGNAAGIRTSGPVFNACTGIVANSAFVRNTTPSGTSGCAVNNTSDMHFMNCLFSGNTSGNTSAFNVRRGSSATTTNSIFFHNTPRQITLIATADSLPCHLELNYNIVQDGIDSISVDTSSELMWGNGNFEADPLFKDFESGDYHLSDESPAIGAGISSMIYDSITIECPSLDIEGNPRPNPPGSSPDIGPFESALGISTPIEELKADIKTLHLFPNPVNKRMTICIQVSKPTDIKARIWNLEGIIVSTITDQRIEKGENTFLWSTGTLPNGLYTLQIQSEMVTITKKVMVIR